MRQAGRPSIIIIYTKRETMENTSSYRSEKFGLLAGALAKAQGTYKPLIANEIGPRGPYANLKATLEAVRESLSQNALAFIQHEELMDEGMGAVILITTIMHESDQFTSSRARIIQGSTLRETGTNTATIKRRQAQTLLGIAPSENDPDSYDDDGKDMAEKHLMKEIRKPRLDQKITDRNDVIDKRQYEELLIELDGYPALADDIMKKHDITTLADLPHSFYHQALMSIRNIKKTQEAHERRSR